MKRINKPHRIDFKRCTPLHHVPYAPNHLMHFFSWIFFSFVHSFFSSSFRSRCSYIYLLWLFIRKMKLCWMIKIEIVTKNGIWKKNRTERVERRQKERQRGEEEDKNPNKNKCTYAVCACARVCVCGWNWSLCAKYGVNLKKNNHRHTDERIFFYAQTVYYTYVVIQRDSEKVINKCACIPDSTVSRRRLWNAVALCSTR